MASMRKQKGMVFHQEGTTAPAAVPAGDHPLACFAVPKPGKACEGGMEQCTRVADEEADNMGKPNMHPSKEAVRTLGGFPATKHPACSNPLSDNLSPDSSCKGIRVTLDNNSMWNDFFRCKTEMILTKQGSRMFPYCRFRISGLHPSRKYSLIMDIQPLDNSRYKWSGKSWQVAGKAECHIKSQPFTHPESPSPGQHWMQHPVSFYKLKLTNNDQDQEGNTILHPMHRYLPRLHVVQTDKAAKDTKLNGPSVVTFTFPQTEFMAVTTYQNSRFAQLKVNYNPFAKGLKEDGSSSGGLKLNQNSGKERTTKGSMANEQHPLKKSLKSLLANHKPRGSKAVDSKPSLSSDLQKNFTPNKDQAAAKVTEESSCNSHPPQKLFSELIREAHVSLQRCNLEQLGISGSTSHRSDRTNTKTTTLLSNGQDVSERESLPAKTQVSPGKKGDSVGTKKKVKENKDLFNSLNCKDNVRTDSSEVSDVVAAPAVSQNSSVDQSEVKGRQHKRPVPLPLPALALFLKQHSTKSKRTRSKPDSPPLALPCESHSAAAASACSPSDHIGTATGPSKDLEGDITNSDNQVSRRPGAHHYPDEMVFNVSEQDVETTCRTSGPSCPEAAAATDLKEPGTDDFLASISATETGPEPEVPDGTSVLLNSDQAFCNPGTSTSISSTLATSSQSPILSPALDTVLLASSSPQTSPIHESSTLPSDSAKSDSLLPDPQCSPFGFESLSPSSSPDTLPSLPTLLTLQLDSTPSEPTPKVVVPPEESPHSEDSAASVFKWHTVLPPPEPYIDTPFTAFQPTPETLPLASVTSHLLPSQSPSRPEPQTFDASTSTPSLDPAPSFQESEQTLPFPAELSPLALQLPLSPTFSSLGGDGLSPTPSIADLVQFFSTDDDLGMGVDFSNTEAVPVPCPPPTTVEVNAVEISQLGQPIPANKSCKRKKKCQRRKLEKTDTDKKIDDSTYTRMQPNLEEVEEQLFISFTSKEALNLHVVDPSEETVPQPQTTPEGHLQRTSDTPENDDSTDVGGSSLPDIINPNNFPAKLWRLVNNPANKAICWDSLGEVIVIDRHLFERQILFPGPITSDFTDTFKTTNFSSFVRQLNLYGFRKADPTVKDDHNSTRDGGAFHHFYNPNFKRDHPELVASLRRLTVDNKAKLQAGLNVSTRPPGRYHRFTERADGRDKTVKRGESPADSSEEKVAALEKILLRDLKQMRHRQVIHPVLQEVGLKMNLLDPTLAIDLQYLGVLLPIPPPGASLELQTQELPPPQGVCAAFVSRTGKTTDVTQIKGWREKFTSEDPSTPAPPKPEAGPSSDLPKKNLSAFCSDMLDEYLENEGKLIDERAASFSQPLVEPVVYELPTKSTSYVRTLNSILKKPPGSSPTSDLISGFIPPSKRPKLTLKETRTSRKENAKQRFLKHTKPRADPAAALSPANLPPKPPAVQILDSVSPQLPGVKKRRRFKPKTLSQTLSPPGSSAPLPGVSEDMAPLESDSELGIAVDQGNEARGMDRGPVMTRALLRQKDLEDGVVWEGRPRTSISEERATIALTSLFTLMGFVSENPTAPIQLVRRRAPPCLNDFCRLGCVCSSLSHCSRVSHCGRPPCMFGCSCLKQKVVLLKNLDGSDSSPSQQGSSRKRRRKRRMKMAYILKEADSVSQPAERVRTLWKRDTGDLDPDPIHVPEPASLSRLVERGENHDSCARVRGYRGKRKIQNQKLKDSLKDVKSKVARLKRLKQRDQTLKETRNKPSSPPPAGDPAKLAPSDRPPSPPAEPGPKPSKRLIILAECKWESDTDRNHVLKKLCERMAWDQLDDPFWIRNYLISPIGQTVEESSAGRCVQYKIHISKPRLQLEKPAAPEKPQGGGTHGEEKQQQVLGGAEPLEDWQREVEEEEVEPLEEWQQEVEMEEAEPLEDWQREVEEGDIEEEARSTVHDGRVSSREEVKSKGKKKMVGMALPFLTGISPAGFLSANKKQPGGTDHLVQVNSKLYPLAKIQLGKMGALHPANRLAAYLTGRVGSSRKQQGPSSSSSKPPQNHSLGPPPQAAPPASSVVSGTANTPPPRSQPSVAVLTIPSSASALQPALLNHLADAPSGGAPEGAGPRVVTVKVYPVPTGGSSQVRVMPGAPVSSAPAPDAQVSRSVAPPVNPKGSQLVIVQVPGLQGKVPVPGPAPPLSTSTGQRMVLQPVQAAPGVQYYCRPDGKLVQLVPISQLRPVNPDQSKRRGSSSPSAPPPVSPQTPVVTVVNQPPPVTTVATCSSSAPSSSLPGLQSFSATPAPSPPCPTSGILTQKGTCTFKILPTNSSKEPLIITCPKVPPRPPAKVVTAPGSFTLLRPPVNLISLKPSAGRGAELGVKAVTFVSPGGVIVRPKPASLQTPPAHRPPPVPPPPPPVDRMNPEPEPACDPLDLDIIFVDEPTGLVTTETEGEAEPEEASSSETENSSDFCDETDGDEEKESMISRHRHIHNETEKQRRMQLGRLFEGLRREVGLSEEKTSKISTLKKAVQLIQELRTNETHLERKKRRLARRRDAYLSTIAPASERTRVSSRSADSDSELSESGQTGSGDTSVTEAAGPLGDTDVSSDKERAVTVTTGAVTNAEDGPQGVAVETVVENVMRNVDPESSLSVQKSVGAQSVSDALKALSSIMNTKNSPKTLLLKQAHQLIKTLQQETEHLTSVKSSLNLQRDAFITEISRRSGKSEQRILRKLQHLLSKQSRTEKRHRAANRLPAAAAGGGASDPPAGDKTDDDIVMTSLTQKAPPNLVAATPTTTPVLQVSKPPPVLPAVSHNASVLRDRPRTVPNILSRSKNLQTSASLLGTTVEGSPSFLVPSDFLSLVTTPLPGQPVLTLGPLMAGPPLLQAPPTPGVASVTLNIPSLTNQQIHLTSLAPPPTGQTCSSSAPLTASHFNLLQLLQQPPGLPSPLAPPPAVPAGLPPPLAPPPPLSSGSDKDQPPTQTDSPESPSLAPSTGDPGSPPSTGGPGSPRSSRGPGSLPSTRGLGSPPSSGGPGSPPSTGGLASSLGPGPGAGLQSEVSVEGPLGPDPDHEGLTSLLNEIVFLNQHVTMETTAAAGGPLLGQQEEGRAHSPWLLQLDSDSDDTVTMEMEEAGLDDHMEVAQQSEPQPAPPPLLQMKVGGAKMADPTISEGEVGEGRGRRREGGVAWRPMPRLVPLGLRGNPPS